MRVIPAASIDAAVTLRDLVEALRAGFRGATVAPEVIRETVSRPGRSDARVDIAPGWADFLAQGHSDRGYMGVRVSTAFPGNAALDRPEEMGVYVLMSGRTGEPLTIIDGTALKLRCAAATSALAAGYLARADARRLLVIGAGALAGYQIAGITAVRPVTEVLVWARTRRKADALAGRMRNRDYRIAATGELEEAVRGADIVVCATSSADPVLPGDWIGPGTHVDLSGARFPDRRQADDRLAQAARIFVDTHDALRCCGDLVEPLDRGVLSAEDVAADLSQLARGEKSGRRFDGQVTAFAAGGSAIADLAAAAHIFMRI